LYFCDAEDQLLSRTSLGFSHHWIAATPYTLLQSIRKCRIMRK
jgi:hypothetical protein